MKTIALFFVLFLTPVSAFAQESILDKFGQVIITLYQLDEELREQDQAFSSFVTNYRDVLLDQKRQVNALLDKAAKASNPQEFVGLMNQAEYKLTKIYQNLELSCPNEWAKYQRVLRTGLNKFWKGVGNGL